MITNRLVSVIIPIYKSVPSNEEKKSLEQCFKTLGHYPIIFFCGLSLDTNYYYRLVSEFGLKFEKRTFEDCYFIDISAYNKLLLSHFFYKSFDDFEFILIYQLDSWVFKDELYFWCDKGYDYIGAPWYNDLEKKEDENDITLIGVGNGGFSLRKTSSILSILKDKRYIPLKTFQRLYNDNKERIKKNPFLIVFYILKSFGYKNNVNYLLSLNINEDGFFYVYANYGGLLKIPNVTEALAFAFELHPEHSFKLNGNNLPFGCHGWLRHEYGSFWEQYINWK